MTPILQVRKVTKNFPHNVVALRGVDLEIMPREIHYLLGANGAGKSTLLKIIAGAHRLDAGEILIAGLRRSFSNPVEAARAGISMIYQELDLIPQLTVAENLFLGRVPHHFGWLGMGIGAISAWARIARVASYPSIPGIWQPIGSLGARISTAIRPSMSARSCDKVFISMQSTTIPGALSRQTSSAFPKKSWVSAEI
jgi:ABC-type Fe3+/spermidine/putrescine transport system ATPase subunit